MRKHIGSSFDDFLIEEDLLGEAEAGQRNALLRIIGSRDVSSKPNCIVVTGKPGAAKANESLRPQPSSS